MNVEETFGNGDAIIKTSYRTDDNTLFVRAYYFVTSQRAVSDVERIAISLYMYKL